MIAGVKDMRFQALMPDVLHWLGIKKVDNMVSMSDMKYDAIVKSGIPILHRYDIPGEWLLFAGVHELIADYHDLVRQTTSSHPTHVSKSTPRSLLGTFRVGSRSPKRIWSRRLGGLGKRLIINQFHVMIIGWSRGRSGSCLVS
jgi:hypothetical protein